MLCGFYYNLLIGSSYLVELDKDKSDENDVDVEYEEHLIPCNVFAYGACQRNEITQIPCGMYNFVIRIIFFSFRI